MINKSGIEINLNHAINGIIYARSVNGDIQQVRILKNHGKVALLTDSKGNQYKLPGFVNVNLSYNKKLSSDQWPNFSSSGKDIENTHVTDHDLFIKTSLQNIYEEYGSEEVFVESYTGDRLGIKISGISEEHYGWPDQKISWVEGNLVVEN